MATNGKRLPPHPEIRIAGGTASPEEAAAIAAALERFLAENAPRAAPEPVSRWQRAALLEGAGHAPGVEPWGARPSQTAC